MNWCLILNVFQTLPKKSTNSISFMHSFSSPLGVFAEAQGILQPHSNKSCYDGASFNIFLSLFLLQGTMLSPYIRVQRSFPVVPVPRVWHWYFTLVLCWGEKSHQMEHLSGSFLLCAAGAGKTSWDCSPCFRQRAAQKDRGLAAVQHRGGLGQAEGQVGYLQYHCSIITS